MAYKIKDGKVVRRLRVGDKIITQTYGRCDAEGREVGLFWFVVPDGMSREEAFASQQHHGPFQTDEEVSESQRVVLLGEHCVVKHGGMWDPAWDTVQ